VRLAPLVQCVLWGYSCYKALTFAAFMKPPHDKVANWSSRIGLNRNRLHKAFVMFGNMAAVKVLLRMSL
jgi:hypothetical protein